MWLYRGGLRGGNELITMHHKHTVLFRLVSESRWGRFFTFSSKGPEYFADSEHSGAGA